MVAIILSSIILVLPCDLYKTLLKHYRTETETTDALDNVSL